MRGEDVDDKPLNRIERRWHATHRELLDATIDELLGPMPTAISASSIARRADRAAGTFFNHFDSVEDAIDEALQPVSALRDGALDILESSEDPRSVMPLVLGSVVATIVSGPREFLATAAARTAGYENPGTRPLSQAVIRALGHDPTANHLAYTTRLTNAIIDNGLLVFSRREDPVSTADVERLAWNLITTAVTPDADAEKLVSEAVEIALGQLDLS